MATRQSVGEHIQRSEDAYEYALSQFETASRQEHYNEIEYSEAQQKLEDAVNDLNKLSLFSNEQQREEIYRKRLQLQTLQNNMILQRSFERPH
ncbi:MULTISPECIES: YtzC family protein [unclassified Bacillus (in: firmicutes)]|uniref:YtzC family protein n=1 Tax=unclassified Bacillus (in: firmicutes) TaxID=185979 RepID=UPI00040DA39E|nr:MULTISPECIES: YtzC family protein [unclassified Bacillus (in: firmicutes)]QHZ48151.1 YtzC family protein [Bacillus sp. NSP9.1]WFA04225.1 YtzC family protein [Bacillus sp. HSf4]